MYEKRFTKPTTFMGLPYSHDFKSAKAAIVGVPFDCGIHPFRIGARQGPQSVREHSRLIRTYNPELSDYNPAERLNAVDCGDIQLTPGRIHEAFERIEETIAPIVKGGTVPIAIGGDGSISYPLLRAVSESYADVVLVHFDSHTDTSPPGRQDEHNAGTQFFRAATEQLVDTSCSYHIGMRGTTYLPNGFHRSRGLGYNLIPQNELLRRGFTDVLDEVKSKIGKRPVYLCFDMDVLDPSCAPGVAAPSWGGLLAREGIEIVRGLTDLNIVAFDINTVSPPHDVAGMAASLAAALIYEFEVLLCRYFGLDRTEADMNRPS